MDSKVPKPWFRGFEDFELNIHCFLAVAELEELEAKNLLYFEIKMKDK